MTRVSEVPIEVRQGDVSAGGWFRRYCWVVLAAVALVVTGMAYSIWWAQLVHHRNQWLLPGDIWGTFRAAHFFGWGDIGDVYNSGSGLVSFPGITVLLAPVAMVSGALGLSESFPLTLAHPSAWLLLGPVELLLGASVLFPLDSLARRLGVPSARRAWLCFAEAAVVWPVVAMWGHPEDVVAMALAVAALNSAIGGRWRSCGWLFGFAIAMQPLVLLAAIVVVGAKLPWRQWPRFVPRVALPSALLLVVPLAQSWHATTHALLQQPNFPAVDHPTPLLPLAPVLHPAHWATVTGVLGNMGTGRMHVVGDSTFRFVGPVVAAGPARTIALAAVVVLALCLRRFDLDAPHLVWWCAVALAVRCVLESVMVPYYVWPAVALLLLVAGLRPVRWWGAVAASLAVTVYAEQFHAPWTWWAPVVALLGAGLATGWPAARARARPIATTAPFAAPTVSRPVGSVAVRS